MVVEIRDKTSRAAKCNPSELKLSHWIALIDEMALAPAAQDFLWAFFKGDTLMKGIQQFWPKVRGADPAARAQIVLTLLTFFDRVEHIVPTDDQIDALDALTNDQFEALNHLVNKQYDALDAVWEILKLKVQLNHQQATQLTQLLAGELHVGHGHAKYPAFAVTRAIAEFWEQHEFDDNTRIALVKIRDRIMDWPETHAPRAARRLTAILDANRTDIPCGLEAGDPWADRAIADWQQMPEDQRQAWSALLQYVQNTSRAKASDAWLDKARPLFEQVGSDAYVYYAATWFDCLGSDKPKGNNSDTLRGLVHAALLLDEAPARILAPHLGDLVEAGFCRSNDGGLVSSKVGLAGLHTLAALPGTAPMVQLSRLKQRVKNAWAHEEVVKVLHDAVRDKGIDLDEVEEAVIPACGFTEMGQRREPFGDYTADMQLPLSSAKSAPHHLLVRPKRQGPKKRSGRGQTRSRRCAQCSEKAGQRCHEDHQRSACPTQPALSETEGMAARHLARAVYRSPPRGHTGPSSHLDLQHQESYPVRRLARRRDG